MAPKPKEYAVNRQYLKDVSFFQMTAFRGSIAETLSTVSKAKARSATLWERVEKLRAFVFMWGEKLFSLYISSA
ncbi:TPA: hypothetical protein P8741_003614 [Acinetobacter baumannii]|uniref:hypothetical protein n=1 Tax=Acinetobacter baumannii TaxID=470 RepID=UPI0011458CD7|nr:hypothetical protein [Acinetobacter baumannii]HDQ4296175.1 hypothetical protein [Acinetobacter baumannii]HDQ4399547.1 hypothetical protein [Acinetobacter baumannii]